MRSVDSCWSTRELVVAALGRRWTRQRVAATRRRDPSLRCVGGVEQSSWTRTASSSRKTMGGFQRKSCSRKALRCLRLRPLVIRTLHHLEDAGRGWRLHRGDASRGRFHQVDALNLDVICFIDEKVFKVDAAAPGHEFFTYFSRGKRSDVTIELFVFACAMRKQKVQLLRRPTFESLFMTHPSQVGSCLSMEPALSPDLSPSDCILWRL